MVNNNLITYRGVFADRDSAIRAVIDYVDAPCMLIRQHDVMTGRTTWRLAPVGTKSHDDGRGFITSVIARKAPLGTWIAAEG